MLQKIEKILILRDSLSITSEYLFATPSGERPYRGSDVIKMLAVEAGVKAPEIFTWTSLRKQVATLSQAMEISETEQDQLAQFLGHGIRVHRDFYRLPHDTLQKAKVAKILMRINSGKISDTADLSVEDELIDEDDDNIFSEASDTEEPSILTQHLLKDLEVAQQSHSPNENDSLAMIEMQDVKKTHGKKKKPVKRKCIDQEQNAEKNLRKSKM